MLYVALYVITLNNHFMIVNILKKKKCICRSNTSFIEAICGTICDKLYVEQYVKVFNISLMSIICY